MNTKKVKLKDLAEILGLSTSTISKSLLGHTDVSAKTKQRVIEMARKLNYQPDLFGKALRTKKTMTIGVIIPNLVLDSSSNILKGVIESAKKSGYRVIISESQHDYFNEKEAIRFMINYKVDGILLSIARESQNIDHILDVGYDTPLVLMDKVSNKTPLTKVVVDEEIGAYKAVEHLLEQNRSRIVIIKEDSKTSNSENRFNGYLKAFRDRGIEIDQALIKECHNMTIEDGFRLTSSLFEQGIPFDGLFGLTDNVAIGAMKAIKKHGLRIPQDIAVVGFSNSKSAAIVEPSLSTVSQPCYEMGKHAVNYLIEEMKTDDGLPHNRTVELKTTLIVRDSSQITP